MRNFFSELGYDILHILAVIVLLAIGTMVMMFWWPQQAYNFMIFGALVLALRVSFARYKKYYDTIWNYFTEK